MIGVGVGGVVVVLNVPARRDEPALKKFRVLALLAAVTVDVVENSLRCESTVSSECVDSNELRALAAFSFLFGLSVMPPPLPLPLWLWPRSRNEASLKRRDDDDALLLVVGVDEPDDETLAVVVDLSVVGLSLSDRL